MAEAVSLLTRFGGGRALTSRAVPWFASVGALIGLVVGGVWWGAGELWPPMVAAVLAVLADLIVTGMLHVDGLADSADGLLPPADRARRLEIMADPSVGAFGVTAVAIVLVLQVAALASTEVDVLLVVAVWGMARLVAALAVVVLPAVRTEGMGALVAGASPGAVAVGALPLVAALVIDPSTARFAAFLCAPMGSFAVLWLARRRLGGITGDVLGAAIVVGQTAGLLVGAARW